jgi:hypothetical protein
MTLIPSYTEDLIYASYFDRLLIKSLGVQAGVVGEEDYKVSAGTGLQVNVKSGKAFVAETKAIEESNNEFYNGLYHVPNPTETNPYNNVEVSSANPQIAQIILRVYDVGELKIGGSSYARVEWLNGTPNAGATKTHVEEGKASEYGAAALPQSSFRICYVVVPKNAALSSEYNIVDSREFSTLGEWKSLLLSSKIEQRSEYYKISARTESSGSIVRLRGNAIVKTGETIKAGNTVVTLPIEYAPKSFVQLSTSFGNILLVLKTGIVQWSIATELAAGSAIVVDGLSYSIR